MAVGSGNLPQLKAIKGVRLATVQAGVKYPNRDDVVLIEIAKESTVACVFTQNQFCAAPVLVAKKHCATDCSTTAARYLLVNTGNANAGTGQQGIANALKCCESVALQAAVPIESILPFSTGVIGEQLPVDCITEKTSVLLSRLSENGWSQAASGILTTDTRPKGISKSIALSSGVVNVTGIAKGAGMLKPNMATMLAYVATDAKLDIVVLQNLLNQCVNQSFNRITVDGDTSTNDACALIATGASGQTVDQRSDDYALLLEGFSEVFIELAQGLVRDGEGASKFVTVNVEGGLDTDECLKVAYTVAESPLVKTALFASDPNWGRLLAAIGRAGVDSLNVNNVAVYLGDVLIAENGCRANSYTEDAGQRVMDNEDISVTIKLGRGTSNETVWTTDLSYDYVRINAEYRS